MCIVSGSDEGCLIMLGNFSKFVFLFCFSWSVAISTQNFDSIEDGGQVPTAVSPTNVLSSYIGNLDCSRVTGCARYFCELGAEAIVSVAVVAGGVALISVASGLQAKGEEEGAHYETRRRYVCSTDSNGHRSCRTEHYTECVGSYKACQDLDAASTLFAIGGCAVLGVGAFWCYKIYNDYERFCVCR